MTDVHVQTKLKQVDALSFTIGVVVTYIVQYIILMQPQLFPLLFYTLMAPLMIHRYTLSSRILFYYQHDNHYDYFRFFAYRAEGSQFFMIDFCYCLQVSTWLQTLYCSYGNLGTESCALWFKTNFVLSHGPIAIAIVAWQNSLVFHSIDKVNQTPARWHR
jgi:hypothetical protein